MEYYQTDKKMFKMKHRHKQTHIIKIYQLYSQM